MGEVDLTEKIGGDFVSHWLNGPQLIENCAFYPFTDEVKPAAGLRPGRVPSSSATFTAQALRKVVLSVHRAESANWARRRMSPGSQNRRGPRAQPEVRSKHQELSRGWE